MVLVKNMTKSILEQIQTLGYDATDMHMDGYFNFGAKQKLYEILWEAERQLERCSTFVGEEKWLQEENQKRSSASSRSINSAAYAINIGENNGKSTTCNIQVHKH